MFSVSVSYEWKSRSSFVQTLWLIEPCFTLLSIRMFSQLEVKEAHGVDAKGVLFIVLGLCSLLFCALIGEFSDPKPKPKRGSHATRVTKKRAAY